MQSKMKTSPLDIFFSLGDKVTKGDPNKKADFDYYMLWIIFLAFTGVMIGNLRSFFINGYQLQYLGWSLFGAAIMWFQYNNLKFQYGARKQRLEFKRLKEEGKLEIEEDIEDLDTMLQEFNNEQKRIDGKDGNISSV